MTYLLALKVGIVSPLSDKFPPEYDIDENKLMQTVGFATRFHFLGELHNCGILKEILDKSFEGIRAFGNHNIQET